MTNKIAVLLALSLSLAAAPITALTIIDNFEEGDFNIVDNTTTAGPTSGEQTGSTSNIAGGVRFVQVNADGLTGLIATGNLATTPADDFVALTANTGGSFNFYYDGTPGGTVQTFTGALNLDLSGEDRLRIEVSQLVGTDAVVQFTMYDSNSTHITANTPLVAGINDLLFSSLSGSIDLTDVRSIRLAFSGIDVQNSIAITSIAAIPEPGTALLLGFGLTGLALRRRA